MQVIGLHAVDRGRGWEPYAEIEAAFKVLGE